MVEAEAFVYRGVTEAVSSLQLQHNRSAGEGFSAAALNLKKTIALGGGEEANEKMQAIKERSVSTYCYFLKSQVSSCSIASPTSFIDNSASSFSVLSSSTT